MVRTVLALLPVSASVGDLGLLIGPGAFAIGSFGCDDGVGAGDRAGVIVRELLLPLASLVVDDVAMASPELDVVVVMVLVSAFCRCCCCDGWRCCFCWLCGC